YLILFRGFGTHARCFSRARIPRWRTTLADADSASSRPHSIICYGWRQDNARATKKPALRICDEAARGTLTTSRGTAKLAAKLLSKSLSLAGGSCAHVRAAGRQAAAYGGCDGVGFTSHDGRA